LRAYHAEWKNDHDKTGRCDLSGHVGNPPALAIKGGPSENELSADRHRSIQEALDTNPGRMICVPAGDDTISEKIRIHGDNSGLSGPGRMSQGRPRLCEVFC
jgi:hypothetical protein